MSGAPPRLRDSSAQRAKNLSNPDGVAVINMLEG